jgi:hypothetical protein
MTAAAQFGAFIQSLSSEDDLGAVVRGQVFVENYLEQIIKARLPNPDKINWDQVALAMRLQLATALGAIPDTMAPALKKLAELRNDFAHDLNAVASEKDVHNVYTCMDLKIRASVDDMIADEPPGAPDIPVHRRKLRYIIAMSVANLGKIIALDAPDYKTAVRNLGVPTAEKELQDLIAQLPRY